VVTPNISTSFQGMTVFSGGARVFIGDATAAAPLSTTSTVQLVHLNSTGDLGLASRGNTASNIMFYTSPDAGTTGLQEKMRIASTGNVGIGTTSPSNTLDVNGTARVGSTAAPCIGSGALCVVYTGSSTQAGVNLTPTASGAASPLVFFNSAGTSQGSISISGGGATSYNTSSDRRLKENISDSTSGLAKLTQIQVEDFNFIKDPSKTRIQGFIAQDLYKIYPEAVTVGGDDAKKNPWSVDYGRLTPLLVKSMRELKSENDNLRRDLKAANDNTAQLRGLILREEREIGEIKRAIGQ
jgi:hypothetical protein